ncbi:hypothetical protein JTB14_021430, partial [Gonioctena quinquepunctata]
QLDSLLKKLKELKKLSALKVADFGSPPSIPASNEGKREQSFHNSSCKNVNNML